MEPIKEPLGKFVKQVKLKYNHDYAPYKFMNPYKLLQALNEGVKGKFDLEFVSVRYFMSNPSLTQPKTNTRRLCTKRLRHKMILTSTESSTTFLAWRRMKRIRIS